MLNPRAGARWGFPDYLYGDFISVISVNHELAYENWHVGMQPEFNGLPVEIAGRPFGIDPG